jgi:hypothetical protein
MRGGTVFIGKRLTVEQDKEIKIKSFQLRLDKVSYLPKFICRRIFLSYPRWALLPRLGALPTGH